MGRYSKDADVNKTVKVRAAPRWASAGTLLMIECRYTCAFRAPLSDSAPLPPPLPTRPAGPTCACTSRTPWRLLAPCAA